MRTGLLEHVEPDGVVGRLWATLKNDSQRTRN